MDKKEFEILVRERDARIEKLIQAKRDVARLKKLQLRTLLAGLPRKSWTTSLLRLRCSTKGSPPRQTSARAQNGPARRFPPPWLIEESAACFIVRDGGSFPHAVVAEMSHPAKLRSRPLGITAEVEAALPSSR
jgi:hypothetical protein